MHDGHEAQARNACGDRVGIDQDIDLNDRMKLIPGISMGGLTPFKSPCTISAL